MAKIGFRFVLACLHCESVARRVQAPPDMLQQDHMEQTQVSSKQELDATPGSLNDTGKFERLVDAVGPSRAFKALGLAINPARSRTPLISSARSASPVAKKSAREGEEEEKKTLLTSLGEFFAPNNLGREALGEYSEADPSGLTRLELAQKRRAQQNKMGIRNPRSAGRKLSEREKKMEAYINSEVPSTDKTIVYVIFGSFLVTLLLLLLGVFFYSGGIEGLQSVSYKPKASSF